MYSQTLIETPTLIDDIFIAGMSNIELEVLRHSTSFEKTKTKPEILYSSSQTQTLKNSIDFAFPNGIDVSLFQEKSKIYAIVLTNEKGVRTYLYILLLYDKVKLNEDDLKVEISKTSITSTSSLSKSFYVPVAICLLSHVMNIDFFRSFLIEINNIIEFDITSLSRNNSSNSTTSEETASHMSISSYQKIELINYFNLISNIIKPPSLSSFNLNMRFSSVSLSSESHYSIPTSNYCIDILFNLLDINTIINLYLALLFEKHVIIIANQNMTLFAICEALIHLIFPFRWLHSYIPNLPYEQMDYLESPTPYLMGLLSSFADANELSRLYPSHVIVDACSSMMFGNVNGRLPLIEEVKIRRKLILLRNKMNNCYDDVYDSNAMEDVEDVNAKMTFGENVQCVFFRLFRNTLKDIKKNYVCNNVFNSMKFLSSFEDEEYKMFFEKLVNTLAFEYFILSMQYLDDSNSRRFNTICRHKPKVPSCEYIYSYSLPSSIDEAQIDNNDTALSSMVKSYNDVISSMSTVSQSIIEKHSKSAQIQQLHFYQKNGFLSFISKYKTSSFLRSIISISYPKDSSYQYYHLMGIDSFIRNQPSPSVLAYMIKSFEKNRIEFNRNALHMILSKFTYNELKMISSSHKFITKSVMYFLRKIEKVKYKTMVISANDSDDDDDDDNSEDTSASSRYRLKRLMTTSNIPNKGINIIKRKKNSVKISLCDIEDDTALVSPIRKKKSDILIDNKDPLALSESIAIKIYSLVTSMKIDKGFIDNNTVSMMRDVVKTDTFNEIKSMILSLGKISLLKISQNANCYYCFWLNVFNFLTIFAIIYKSEIITNYYEFYRFLKNSYFVIGGCEISLYEIENIIIRKNEISKRIFGEIIKSDIKNLPRLDYYDDIINFGISLPNISSPILRIYFPNNFKEGLRLNAIEFFSRLMKFDFDNIKLALPEYLLWIDKDFIRNIENYSEILPKEIVEYIKENDKKIKIVVDKYNWKISFQNIKNIQNI